MLEQCGAMFKQMAVRANKGFPLNSRLGASACHRGQYVERCGAFPISVGIGSIYHPPASPLYVPRYVWQRHENIFSGTSVFA
jgi:hypothetical protein